MKKIYITLLSFFVLDPLSAQPVLAKPTPESIAEQKELDAFKSYINDDAWSIDDVKWIDCLNGYQSKVIIEILGARSAVAICEQWKRERIQSLQEQAQADQANQAAAGRALIASLRGQDRLAYFFPDDSYLGLKCTRDRATVDKGLRFDHIGKEPFEGGRPWVLQTDNLGIYVNEFNQVIYFVLSPSNKKGWTVAAYSHLKKKSTNLWEFGYEDYRAGAPFELTRFEATDYAYVVDAASTRQEYEMGVTPQGEIEYTIVQAPFKDTIEYTFNREDLSFGIPLIEAFNGRNRAGSCKIMDASEFFSDIDSMNDRTDRYKAHNQKIIDAKKSKRIF